MLFVASRFATLLLLCCFSGRLPIRLSYILRIVGLTCYAATRKGERERDSLPIYQETSVFFSRSVTVFMQQRYYLLEYPSSVLQVLSRQLSEIIYCEELGCRIIMFSRDEKGKEKGEVVIAPLE